MSEKTIIWRGLLCPATNGKEDELLGIWKEGERTITILAEDVFLQQPFDHNFLSVRYFTSDKPVPADKIEEEWVKTLFGAGEVDYGIHCNEITGYLWTDQLLNVGGHNLLAELYSHLGKYAHLEIKFSDKPCPA